jgi:hypothetical protein
VVGIVLRIPTKYLTKNYPGDTQWERPCLEVGAGNISDKMTNYNSDINYVKGSHDSMNNINRTTNYQQDSHQQGNFEYTHQRSYDSDMFSSHHYNLESSSASRTINFDNNNTSCNQFVDNGSITSNNCNQDDERGRSISRGRQNNMNNADTILTHRNMILTENLPRGWLALEDPDSGETYFANEVTGELTWDRPKMQQTETNFDDDLPTGWIALEDADSGETYYLNEATMATTWDRPNEENGSEIDENNREHQSSEIVGVSCNNEDLPPGWEAILDPSSGDYYFAHESGETQWELPEFDQAEHDVAFDASGDHARSGGNDRFESPIHKSLLPGWFAAFDEDSGDHYYCNEETGETTWDIPSVAATPHDNPNDPVQASVAEEVEDDYHDIPPGWFSVKDPDSADIYFCNEETGETTWDHPASASRDANEQSISVYEDDSVSSSKY